MLYMMSLFYKKKVLASEEIAILMCVHGFLSLFDEVETNKSPFLIMAVMKHSRDRKGRRNRKREPTY